MSDLYERDFYAWINTQVALLRAGDFARADIENIVEEIEALGRTERREFRRRLEVLLLRLLRWRFQSGARCSSWELRIELARDAVAERLSDSPSLKSGILELMASAYSFARRRAAVETDLDLLIFPSESPWSFEQAMQDAP